MLTKRDIMAALSKSSYQRGRALKVTTEIREDHQAHLTLTFEASEFERAKRRAARTLSRKVKIPGFRPGKAPYEVVVRYLGEAEVIEEAVDALLQEYYLKALDEVSLTPYAPGELEEVILEGTPVIKVRVPLAPEVELGNFEDLRLPYEPEPVTEEEVDQALESLREMHAVIEPVDRPVKIGDLVYITIRGQGQRPPKEGEEEPEEITLPARQLPLVVHSEPQENEWPYPGFSQELVGLSKGDEKEVTYTYPEDHEQDEALQGATMIFTFAVDEVKSRILPELNDAFAQTVNSEYETIEDLRKAVRESLENEKKSRYDEEYAAKAIKALLEEATVKYPPKMVEDELDFLLNDLRGQLARQGMSLEMYLKMREMDEAALRDEMREEAEQRVRERLVAEKLGELWQVEPSEEEVMTMAQQRWLEIAMGMEEKQARQLAKDNDFVRRLISSVAYDITLGRTVERLMALAKGELENEEANAEETESTPEGEDAPQETASSPEGPESGKAPQGQDEPPASDASESKD
ncbi:MAG TPA: trigger factor [Anaerolineales bacterium]|nr:trigger factor [Anaerolineales bacterium]